MVKGKSDMILRLYINKNRYPIVSRSWLVLKEVKICTSHTNVHIFLFKFLKTIFFYRTTKPRKENSYPHKIFVKMDMES